MHIGGVGVPQLPRQGSAGTLVDPGALTRGLSRSVSFAWLWSQTRALAACSVPRPVLVSRGQLLLGFLGNFCGSTSCCCCGRGARGQLCEHHPSWEGRLSSVGCSARGLSRCRGWHGPRAQCQAGQNPEQQAGAPELKVGGGNALLGPQGSSLLCISSSNRSQMAKGNSVKVAKVSVPGNGKLCCFREQKQAPSCGTVPACSGRPVLLAGQAGCLPSSADGGHGHAAGFWPALPTAACADPVTPGTWVLRLDLIH